MTDPASAEPHLPAVARRVLEDFVTAARQAFGDHLRSVVLFGSAADGTLRPTSDVNVIALLSTFEREEADRVGEAYRMAEAALHVRVLFLLESELEAAAREFAVKFGDVRRRHHVLYGADPFAQLAVPRAALAGRLRQVLLNLMLRLRDFYVRRSLQEEQLAMVIADAAGPLRSAAAGLLELEGKPVTSPKEALESVAASLALPSFREAVQRLSEVRRERVLPQGVAVETVFSLIELARLMRSRVEALS